MTLYGDDYQASIPALAAGNTIQYYIYALDEAGNTNYHPYGALANFHSFECKQSVRVVLDSDDTFLHPGDTLIVQVTLENLSNQDQSLVGRADIFFQSGSPYSQNPITGPVNFTLKAGKTISRNFNLQLPAKIPPKLFYYRVTLGTVADGDLLSKKLHFFIQ
jgi:hypothetical protein